MRLLVIYFSVLVGCLGLAVFASRFFTTTPCLCWAPGQDFVVATMPHRISNEYVSFGSYGSDADWNNPDHIIPLNYSQTQGKRIFYQQCVWCHADTTPAGPSNRANVTPTPPLMNDGAVLNRVSDASLQSIIALGGSAVDKSAMMPPYGMSLSQDQIANLIAYIRAISVPEYHPALGMTYKSLESRAFSYARRVLKLTVRYVLVSTGIRGGRSLQW
jgi:mono/diheme cytochrome c family protein